MRTQSDRNRTERDSARRTEIEKTKETECDKRKSEREKTMTEKKKEKEKEKDTSKILSEHLNIVLAKSKWKKQRYLTSNRRMKNI